MPNQPPDSNRRVHERVSTGVAGLDVILHGGLFRGASCLIVGEPGTGKTTLGSQMAYEHAKSGGTAIFFTVVAESHDRMVGHLANFDFFDSAIVGSSVFYYSLIETMAEHGVRGALDTIRRSVREHGARVVVIDGAARFQDFATSRVEYRHFVADLISQLGLLGCATLLLAQPDAEKETLYGIGTLVDSLIILEDQDVGSRPVRMLHVTKLRGSPTVRGVHEFAITDAGIEVYPRLEALPPRDTPDRPPRQRRLAFGIDGLDSMLRGGLLTGSTTMVVGPPGIGKTTLGLHFLAEGAHREEPGLFASFGEAPERLIAKADLLGMNLGEHAEAGRVRFQRQLSASRPLDAWAEELLATVDSSNAQRLVIDGLTDLEQMADHNDRLVPFLVALCHRLRAQGVATLLSAETPTVEDIGIAVPLADAAAALDNVVLLRYVEPRSRLHRLISILRVRESGFDPTVREFSITDRGIEVEPSNEGAESVLNEVAGQASHAGRSGQM